MVLEVRNIVKTFDGIPALRGVSVDVAEGEILCLLGPSGCGKSTLLRIIAGLERADAGQVMFEGRSVDPLPAHRRGFGLMFQDFALFPHRTVAENVAFGLRMQRLPDAEIERRVTETLEMVGLSGYGDRTIYELSGGERQRVALARSLAPRPRMLMLDEPLGSLDRSLRERLTEELRELIDRLGLTAIYVTHDQAEAFAIADRIALMQAGRIVQQGPPSQLYRCPLTPFVARFLGLHTIVPGRIVEKQGRLVAVETPLGCLLVDQQSCAAPSTSIVQLVIRPEAGQPAVEDAPNIITGQVIRRTFQGPTERVVLRHSSGAEITLSLSAIALDSQEVLQISLHPEAISFIPEVGTEAEDEPADSTV